MVATSSKGVENSPVVNGSKDETNEKEATEEEEKAPKTKDEKLDLRLVFLYNMKKDATPSFDYKVVCHKTTCREEILKTKKNQTMKSDRKTNITWTENWLKLFKDDSRLIEVINVGEMNPPIEEPTDVKSKKPKPREFQVSTLCFYEKPLPSESAASEKHESYDSLTREVWAPVNDTMQESLENEAEALGEQGWELCSVLATSQVRMKPDGSEFRKYAIFFQRPKKETVPKSEIGKSKENLLENGSQEQEDEVPSSPKEKLQKFGVAIVRMEDVKKPRLKSTSNTPSSPVKKEETTSALSAIQLKKVDREKLKKEDTNKDVSAAQQVKLKPTGSKSSSEAKEDDKEVPWMATLERKRKAVMESEEKAIQKKQEQQEEKVNAAETETLNVAALTKKVEEANAEAAKSADEQSKREKQPTQAEEVVSEPEQVQEEKAELEPHKSENAGASEKEETEEKEIEEPSIEALPATAKVESEKSDQSDEKLAADSEQDSPQDVLPETTEDKPTPEKTQADVEGTVDSVSMATEALTSASETSTVATAAVAAAAKDERDGDEQVEENNHNEEAVQEKTNENIEESSGKEPEHSKIEEKQSADEKSVENVEPVDDNVEQEASPVENSETEAATVNASKISSLDAQEEQDKTVPEPDNSTMSEQSEEVKNDVLPLETPETPQVSAEEPVVLEADLSTPSVVESSSPEANAEEVEADKSLPDVDSGTDTNVPDVESKTDTNIPDVASNTDIKASDVESNIDTNIPDVEPSTNTNIPDAESNTDTNIPDAESNNETNLPDVEETNEEKNSNSTPSDQMDANDDKTESNDDSGKDETTMEAEKQEAKISEDEKDSKEPTSPKASVEGDSPDVKKIPEDLDNSEENVEESSVEVKDE